MYHYLGNERLQFWFFSPNVCAAFLVITTLLTAGAFLFAVEHKGKWPKIGAGLWVFYLLLYNFMFIVPLLVIFYFAWYGSTTLALIRWSKRQVVYSKILMSLFFW